MIVSLKSFGNSSGNSCTKFVKLDIKCRLTCGDLDLYQIIDKFKNILTEVVVFSKHNKAIQALSKVVLHHY